MNLRDHLCHNAVGRGCRGAAEHSVPNASWRIQRMINDKHNLFQDTKSLNRPTTAIMKVTSPTWPPYLRVCWTTNWKWSSILQQPTRKYTWPSLIPKQAGKELKIQLEVLYAWLHLKSQEKASALIDHSKPNDEQEQDRLDLVWPSSSAKTCPNSGHTFYSATTC